MQVIVDERAYSGRLSESHTVQEFADEICSDAAAQDRRMIVGLSCNGQPVASEQLADVLRSPAGSFQTLEIQTVFVREQVQLTLTQGLAVIRVAHTSREQAADLLDQGRHEAAMAQLQQLLEIFRQVQQTTMLACELLQIDLETLAPGGRSLVETLSMVREQLTRLKEGMESQDFVTVSDLLRYEFSGPLNAWEAILTGLSGLAESNSPDAR